MTRQAMSVVLLLFGWSVAAGLRAEDGAPEKPEDWPFPIYHEPPGSSGLSAGSYFPTPNAPRLDPAATAYDPVTRPWASPLAHLLDPDQPAKPDPAPLLEGRQDWLSGQFDVVPGQSLNQKTEGPFGSMTAQVVWRDPRELRDAPVLDGPWKADHSWKLPVAGPVFVFGQFDAAPDPVTNDELKLQGKTGVGCKLPVPFGIEVQLRGGRSLVHNDPLGSDHGDRSQVFVEVQARCPLPGQLGLEYQGSAIPALTPLERDRINQDLGLALPVCDGGKLRLGAKHQWESTPTPKSILDGVQLYVGFELNGGTSKQ